MRPPTTSASVSGRVMTASTSPSLHRGQHLDARAVGEHGGGPRARAGTTSPSTATATPVRGSPSSAERVRHPGAVGELAGLAVDPDLHVLPPCGLGSRSELDPRPTARARSPPSSADDGVRGDRARAASRCGGGRWRRAGRRARARRSAAGCRGCPAAARPPSRPARTRRSAGSTRSASRSRSRTPADGHVGVETGLGLGGPDARGRRRRGGRRRAAARRPARAPCARAAGSAGRGAPAAGSRPSPVGPARPARGAAGRSARPRRRGRRRRRHVGVSGVPPASRTPPSSPTAATARGDRLHAQPARRPPAARRAAPGCRRRGRRAPTARRGRPGRARAPACAARGRSAGRPRGPGRARYAASVSSSARSPAPVAATTVPSRAQPGGRVRRRRRAPRRRRASGRPTRRPSVEQLLLARPGLGDRGEHAARRPRSAPDAGAGSSTVTARRPPRGPPGTAQADHARAHHQRRRSASHSAPCAGMTRIRFDGRDPARSPLSPPSRAPVRHLPHTLRPGTRCRDDVDVGSRPCPDSTPNARRARLAEHASTSAPAHAARGDLAEFADAALAGGVDILQLRDKGPEAAGGRASWPRWRCSPRRARGTARCSR